VGYGRTWGLAPTCIICILSLQNQHEFKDYMTMENCHCQDEHVLPVHGRCLSQLSWGRGSVCSQGHVANGYHMSHGKRVLPTCVFSVSVGHSFKVLSFQVFKCIIDYVQPT